MYDISYLQTKLKNKSRQRFARLHHKCPGKLDNPAKTKVNNINKRQLI